MAEVRITHSSDKAAVAARLSEAIADAGYDVAPEEIEDIQDLFELPQTSRATLLIWSRPLVSSALRPGALRQLRQQRSLIEVSADGIGPPAAEGDNHVILISGWRGQPYHPGWQRIASDLERLCGSPARASSARAQIESVMPLASSARQEDPPAAVRRRTPARPGGTALALLAAIGLFGAGFGAATWIGKRAPEPRLDIAAASPASDDSSKAITSKPRSRADRTANGQSVPAKSIPPIVPIPRAESQAPKASSPISPAPPSGTGSSERTPKADKAKAPRRDRDSLRPQHDAKRYSRKNSSIMRLFCEGSGRSTPQCKTFLNSTRGSSRRR